uniref:Uncharacterized protein n=1 Tax=Peronospora matthiolae TaxID=2874970 RepID=A0AAV1UKZ4_9STRA
MYGAQFELSEWQSFMNSTVVPLAVRLCETRDEKSSLSLEKIESKASTNVMLHQTRANSEKQ